MDSTVNAHKSLHFYIFFGAIFLLLAAKLFQLQILESKDYFQLSEENRLRMLLIPAPRGKILDRHHKVLVDDYPAFSISIIPTRKKISDDIINLLSEILEEDKEIIKEKIQKGRIRPYQPMPLKRNADEVIVAKIAEHSLDLPNVIIQKRPLRRYIYAHKGCHLLGYVGELTEKELDKLEIEGYRMGDLIGRTGIEKVYEEYIRGVYGGHYVEVDALGRELGDVEGRGSIFPIVGNDVILNIDWELQEIAENAFKENQIGTCVALDPRDGSVLVMVSKPEYDPNRFAKGLSRSELYTISSDTTFPLLNRAIQSAYPPGSTFKVITSLAGLQEGYITNLYSRMSRPCTGAYVYGRRSYGCWKHSGHGSYTVQQALTQSCDVYFYQLGLKLGLIRLGNHAKSLGCGIKTGIDLPQETSALIPDEEYYRKRTERGGEGWSNGMLLNLSIGQGEILVTCLQLANIAAIIGNGGTLYTPHLLKEIRNPEGEVIEYYEPKSEKISIEPQALEALHTGMYGVVNGLNGLGGTAHRAKIDGVKVCGKTGTAQNSHGDDHGLFICFAPMENPEIAIGVIVEKGRSGGGAAAPIAGAILRTYFARKQANETAAADTLEKLTPLEQ